MTDEVDSFLSHYGVKGMKWGQTKAKYQKKIDRKKVIDNVKKNYSLKNTHGKVSTGASVAGILVAGPLGANTIAGFNFASAAGYSRGQSVAIGLLGGAPGGILAAEVAVRKRKMR